MWGIQDRALRNGPSGTVNGALSGTMRQWSMPRWPIGGRVNCPVQVASLPFMKRAYQKQKEELLAEIDQLEKVVCIFPVFVEERG